MRLIQILIPEGRRASVLDTLDDLDMGYYVVDETGSQDLDAVISIPVPTTAVEPVLEELRSVGIDDNTYTIILQTETIISQAFDDLVEEHTEEVEEQETGISGEVRIAREELESRAKDLVMGLPIYITLTLISAVIATAGLLMDSPATVVGSMVIAPLIGPSMAASVGTAIGDRTLFRRGIKMQLVGVGAAIFGATVFGLMVRYLFLVPPGIDVLAIGEINERAVPSFLLLAIALGAGIAGMLSLITGVSTALVGVMIAVALIPPAAAVGVGIAFNVPRLTLGASVIVAVNVLSINLASLIVLWSEGYQPKSWIRIRSVRGTVLKQIIVLIVAIGLVSTFLVGVTYDSYNAATTEEEIRSAIEDELEAADAELRLHSLMIDRTGLIPPLETDRVVIQIAIDPDADIPFLVDRLTQRIGEVTERSVTVEVEFLLVQQSSD